MTQVREEVYFSKGRVIVRGKTVQRGAAKKADYILSYKPNIPLAVLNRPTLAGTGGRGPLYQDGPSQGTVRPHRPVYREALVRSMQPGATLPQIVGTRPLSAAQRLQSWKVAVGSCGSESGATPKP